MRALPLKRRLNAAVTGLMLVVAACSSEAAPSSTPAPAASSSEACGVTREVLRRIARGYTPDRSEDVIVVPRVPNYLGSFTIRSHSGPWRYLQRVPLVLYGPRHIRAEGSVDRRVTVADVYPTMGRMLGVDLPPRKGRLLEEAVFEERRDPPRLVVVLVWDGAGVNVLTRWIDEWPTLAEMAAEGTAYWEATVGSSPSITPATHATLGTGWFPRAHKVNSIKYRRPDGRVDVAFRGRDPEVLKSSTFADTADLAFANRSNVGLVGTRAWHMGMLGHGAATAGGDKDHLVLLGLDGHIFGNTDLYATPGYLRNLPSFDRRMKATDLSDGQADGLWRKHPMDEQHDNPGWSQYQTDVVLKLMRTEGYGADEVPDLMFVNYKMTDIVGHQYSMESPEMGEIVAAQDASLRRLKSYLDREVKDYAVVLTADHGHTPPAEVSGGWPILQGELADDINRHFDVPSNETLVDTMTAVGLFLQRRTARSMGISAADVAGFLAGYTIGENWSEDDLPEGYEDRRDEPVYDAAFAGSDLGSIEACSRSSEGAP